MPAGYQDFYLEKGTTFNTNLTLDGPNGVVYNLTNFTVKSQAKKSYYSANSTITFVSTITDPANGVIQLSASAANTANLPAGKLVYDVIITDNFGNVSRVLEGQTLVSPSVTS